MTHIVHLQLNDIWNHNLVEVATIQYHHHCCNFVSTNISHRRLAPHDLAPAGDGDGGQPRVLAGGRHALHPLHGRFLVPSGGGLDLEVSHGVLDRLAALLGQE